MTGLRYATLVLKRPSLTRDLPHGPTDLLWITNTATLVYGAQDAVLVDTFTTTAQNADLVKWIGSFGRRLTHVYVTHGPGDHFFGVSQVLEAFPGAVAVATAGSIAKAHEHGSPEMIDSFWGRLFPGEIPDPLRVPTLLDGSTIDLEGHRIEVLEMGFTDTRDTTSVWVPDLRLVISGDVVYTDAHPYLAETDSTTRENWRHVLRRLADLDPAVVVAGHKHSDAADTPDNIAATIAYLEDFERLVGETVDQGGNAVQLYDALLALHPTRANPGSAWAAAQTAIILSEGVTP